MALFPDYKSEDIFKGVMEQWLRQKELAQQAPGQAASAATLNAKLPYVGPQAQADLTNQQNINKYYGRNIESEIGLRGAQTNTANAHLPYIAGLDQAETAQRRAGAANLNADALLNQQKYENPGLTGTGTSHDLAVLSLLQKKHPELAEQLHQEAKGTLPGAEVGPHGAAPQNPMQSFQQAVSGAETPSPASASPPAASGMNPADILQRSIAADIAEKEAHAKYYSQGMGGRGGVTQKAQQQLLGDVARENPNFSEEQVREATNNLLSGKKSMDDGSPIKVGGIITSDLNNVLGTKASTAIKNQLVQYDNLSKDLHSFDIKAVSKFAGPLGKVKLAQAKIKMATNPDDPTIDPMARRYLSAMANSIQNMDALRKAYGSSVVPKYVTETLGALTNPNSSIWNDPKQVEKTYNSMMTQIDRNKDSLMKKVREGVLAGSDDEGASEVSVEGQEPPQGSSWWIRPDRKKVLVHDGREDEALKLNYKKVS